MTEQESQRIASLTTGAIQTTMENAAKAMMAAVEAAEEKARELREATEQFIEDSVKVTGELADNVNAHIVACQAAIDTFQAHHLKILNIDPPESKTVEELRTRARPADDGIAQLRAVAQAVEDGRR